MSRLAVYGGRFDPFHAGHMDVARRVLADLPADELVVVPSGSPPHKGVVAPFADRLAMCELACARLAGVAVLDIEAGDAASYTIDTLAALPEHSGAPIMVVGGDAFAAIESWRGWQRLLEKANWAVVPRPPDSCWRPVAAAALGKVLPAVVDEPAALAAGSGRVHVWGCETRDVSAAGIRSMVAAGSGGWRDLVPAAVAGYIDDAGLYQGA